MKVSIVIALSLLLIPSTTLGASLDKAKMLRLHGLIADAKKELIEVVFSDQDVGIKSQAYYILGAIAFEEEHVSVALDTWTRLVSEYPESEQANLVKDRITQLSEVVSESSRTHIENAIAQSYLQHGGFWSKSKSDVFVIDSSWLPRVEAAVNWYDKVIDEFPGTIASRVAYEDKMRTLIGWEDPGRYGQSHGIKRDFKKYMSLLIETFTAYEREFPESSSLQAFRFQIAQGFWRNKDWTQTRTWLNTIIEKSGIHQSFYGDLAKRRLSKVEY